MHRFYQTKWNQQAIEDGLDPVAECAPDRSEYDQLDHDSQVIHQKLKDATRATEHLAERGGGSSRGNVTAQILTLFKIFAKQNFLPYFKFSVAIPMPSLILKPWPGLRMFGFGLRDFKPMIWGCHIHIFSTPKYFKMIFYFLLKKNPKP